jgi:shikimate dehydrogenase
MLSSYSGATRVYPIVGDPIAQVKAPFGVTAAFEARGADAICVPFQVRVADFAAFMSTMLKSLNVDGVIITVPHKFAAFDVCDRLSDRARFLRSVNTIRKAADGAFVGDMFDGLGFVEACRARGASFAGKRALLVGVGGAGTAIAHAIATRGVSHLSIYDQNHERRDGLALKLQQASFNVEAVDRPDPGGFGIVCNATPLGMRAGDPLPFDVSRVDTGAFVGDVVTKPEITPLIAAARARGLGTSTGVDMFAKVRDLMVDFLLAPPGKG